MSVVLPAKHIDTEGHIQWTDEPEKQSTFAAAAFKNLNDTEPDSKRGSADHGYRRAASLFANADMRNRNGPHTVFVPRDGAFESLTPVQRDILGNPDTDRKQAIAQAVAHQHMVSGFVTDGFMAGSTEEHVATLPTFDSDINLRILAPRVAKEFLPAGAKLDVPIVQLLNKNGTVLKTVSARRVMPDPDNTDRQFIVVDGVLAV